MMRQSQMIRLGLAFLAAIVALPVFAQSVQQSGPVVARHLPGFVQNGYIGDSGYASGFGPNNGVGVGIAEQLLIAPTSPTGPLGTNWCNYDHPITNPSGYHYLCLSPNAQGGGLIDYGAGGGATPLPLTMTVNGSSVQFPFILSGILGPNPSNIGDVPVFANGTGTLVSDGGPPAYGVPLITDLQSLPLTGHAAGFAVRTAGYYATGDSPQATYTLSTSSCSLNAGAGDGGSQIPSNTSGNCWLLGALPSYDIRMFGAVDSATSTTGTISASATALTVASTSTFSVGQNIDVYGAGAGFVLNPPATPSAATEGTTGSTTYCYRIVSIDADHGYGAATTEVCATDGNATRQVPQAATGARDELVQWSAPSGTPPTSYAVYGGGSGAEVCRAVTVKLLWRDYNQPNGCPSWLPASAPGSARADLLRAKITQKVGSVLTITPAATTSVTSASVQHDNTTPLQNALNVEPSVTLPCQTFHVTQGLAMSAISGQKIAGTGKECTTITADGAFNIVSIGNPGLSTIFSPTLRDLNINGAGMVSGFATSINNANRVLVQDVVVTSPYNEMEVTNSFIGKVDDYWSLSQRRGDIGWHYWGTGTGNTGGATQAGVYDLYFVNSASAYQGVSFHVDGNAVSLRSYHLGLEGAGVELLVDNASNGGGTAPTYGYFYTPGFNTCWTKCIELDNATNFEFDLPYVQQVSGGGANAEAALIASTTSTVKFQRGVMLGAVNGITDHGFGLTVDGMDITASSNAAIECASDAVLLMVSGGTSLNILTPADTSSSDYGIKLDAGCTKAHIEGLWRGQKANVYDLASPTTEVVINGLYRPPPPTVINAAGNQTLTAATYKTLYTGQPGYMEILEASGFASDVNYTTDTATNILASLFNPQVGTPVWIELHNHNASHTVTLVGGAGVTVSGTAIVPVAPATGGQSVIIFKGVVTNVGSPAILIKGCSTTAGAAC